MKKIGLSIITISFFVINVPVVAQYYLGDGYNDSFQQQELQRQQENRYQELERRQDIMEQQQRDYEYEQEQRMRELEARSRSRSSSPGWRADGPLR